MGLHAPADVQGGRRHGQHQQGRSHSASKVKAGIRPTQPMSQRVSTASQVVFDGMIALVAHVPLLDALQGFQVHERSSGRRSRETGPGPTVSSA